MNRFLILASLLLVASCSKEQVEPNSDTQKVTLTASLSGETATRVLPNVSDDDTWTFEWEDGDALSAWHNSSCTAPEKFAMADFDGDNSTFSGTLGSGDMHRFIYPHKDGVTITSENFYYPVDVSVQDGTLDKTYLINDAQITTSSIAENTVSSLDMKHVGGFMVVDIFLENFVEGKTYTLKKVVYSSAEGIIPVSAEIDMTKGVDEVGFCNNISYGALTSEVSEPFNKVTHNEVNYLQAITRLNILPFTVAESGTATISLTIEVSKEGIVLETLTSEVTVTNTSGGDLPFARATHNFTYLTLDGSYGMKITGCTINGWGEVVESGDVDLAACTYTASEIDADNVPKGSTWTITDSGTINKDLMVGVRAALEVAKAESRSIKIILPNATEIRSAVFNFYDDDGSYEGVSALTDIEMPKVAYIGSESFRCCGLTSFDFKGVIDITEATFSECTNLTEVYNFNISTIPRQLFTFSGITSFDFTGVTEIGIAAFAGCPSLTEIELPATVTSIGYFAFGASAVKVVTLNWEGDEILTYNSSDDMWFEGAPLEKIYIPSGTKDAYVAKEWPEDLLVEKE